MIKSFLIFLACLIGFCPADKDTKNQKAYENIRGGQIVFSSHDFEKRLASSFYRADTLSGNYLAARFAQNNNDWREAGIFLDQVQRKDKDNRDVLNKSMVLAIGAGLPEKGIALAKKVVQAQDEEGKTTISPADVTPESLTTLAIQNNVNNIAHLLLFADFVQKNDFESAESHLQKINKGGIASFIKPVLESWVDAANGKRNIADLTTNTVHIYHALMIKAYLGDKTEFEPFLGRALSAEGLSVQDLERIGDVYTFLDQHQTALKIYQEALRNWPDNEDIADKVALLSQAIENTDQDASKPAFFIAPESPKKAIAMAFYDIAQLLFREFSDDSVRVFANTAKFLDPNLHKADLLLGYVYARHKLNARALQLYHSIPETDVSNYRKAQGLIADLYEKNDDIEKAVNVLKAYYAKTQHIDSLLQIGDVYRRTDLYMDAALYYDRAEEQILKETGQEQLDKSFWHLHYARGMALERAGKWERAEKDLQTALNFRPNDALILNYLGYAWADQGENLDKAYDMIEQAAALEPNDGYIVDSLGWVLYRMKNYKDAAKHLEHAVQLMPYDSTVNDHLGDAYWKLGRKIEARFQWQRALNNIEESDLNHETGEYETMKKSLTTKLKHGLKPKSEDTKVKK